MTITLPQFLDAIESQTPLLNEGDTLSNEVVKRIFFDDIEFRPASKDLRILTQNLKRQPHEKGPKHVLAAIVCSSCGKEHFANVTRTMIVNRNLPQEILLNTKTERNLLSWAERSVYDKISDQVFELADDGIICQECFDHLKEMVKEDLEEISGDPISWYLKNANSSDWKKQFFTPIYDQRMFDGSKVLYKIKSEYFGKEWINKEIQEEWEAERERIQLLKEKKEAEERKRHEEQQQQEERKARLKNYHTLQTVTLDADLDAEQRVLGFLLRADQEIIDAHIDAMERMLEPGMFFCFENSLIFKHILSICHSTKYNDIFNSLITRLKENGLLETIGGDKYLQTLYDIPLSPQNIMFDTYLVAKNYAIRTTYCIAEKVRSSIITNPGGIRECIDTAMSELSEIRKKSYAWENVTIDAPRRGVTPLRVMNFGKFRGMPVMDVIVNHPDYIQWAVENTSFRLTDEESIFFNRGRIEETPIPPTPVCLDPIDFSAAPW